MVTVLINTYNDKPEWLRQSIESYLANNVKKQIIVASLQSDENIDLIKSYGKQIELSLFSEKEHPGKSIQGAYYQINNSLHRVRGIFFCLMSGNDFAANNKLLVEREILINNDKSVCYSNFWECDENGNKGNLRRFPKKYNYQHHLSGNYVSDASMVRVDLLKKYAPFKERVLGNYAHWDFWLRIFEGEGDVFINNELPTWYYRQDRFASHKNRTPEQIIDLEKKLQLLKAR